MFGLAERSRLAMYSSTLRQTIEDAKDDYLFYPMALMAGTALLGDAGRTAAGKLGTFQLANTLDETIQSIPSASLQSIDAIMLHSIKSPYSLEDAPLYQMATLINGLVFVRIVEVSRPPLRGRAHSFYSAAIAFIEPHYRAGFNMMVGSEVLPHVVPETR